jgi:hypothetical protein
MQTDHTAHAGGLAGASVVGQLAGSTATWLVVGALLALALLVTRIAPTLEAGEPPLLKPGIPVVGHILGLVRYQVEYLTMLQYARFFVSDLFSCV